MGEILTCNLAPEQKLVSRDLSVECVQCHLQLHPIDQDNHSESWYLLLIEVEVNASNPEVGQLKV